MTDEIGRTNDERANTLSGKVGDAVVRYAAGDKTAMTGLVRTVTPWLLHICRGYRLSADSAQDVVQTTLLTLVQHVHTLRNPDGALSWLSVVARREALRVVGKEKRVEPVADITAFDRPSRRDDPQSVVEVRMAHAAVLRNLAMLPERSRGLLYLLFLADITTYADIADLLDVPIGSIGPTRRRGLDAMGRLLAADPEWEGRRCA
jgi:RNA polymerase sigma factor (sigma-70 family)